MPPHLSRRHARRRSDRLSNKMGTPYYKLHLWWNVPAYPHHWQNSCTWKMFSMQTALCGIECSAPSHDKFNEYCIYITPCTWKMSLQYIFRPQHLQLACNQTSSSGIRLTFSQQQPECDFKITAVRLASSKFTIWCPHTAFRSLLCTFPSSHRHNSYTMFHLTDNRHTTNKITWHQGNLLPHRGLFRNYADITHWPTYIYLAYNRGILFFNLKNGEEALQTGNVL
jgi:hypothetical protein